jgi:hypothetical protein
MKMDPITVILTALATGAAAGVTSTATDAIKDAYGALKSLVKARYATVRVDALEKKPDSKSSQRRVEEDLKQTDAGSDQDLVRLAQQLIALIREAAPETAQVVGLNIEGFEAGELLVEDVESSGTGVSVRDTKVTGRAEFKNVRGGSGRSKG